MCCGGSEAAGGAEGGKDRFNAGGLGAAVVGVGGGVFILRGAVGFGLGGEALPGFDFILPGAGGGEQVDGEGGNLVIGEDDRAGVVGDGEGDGFHGVVASLLLWVELCGE